MKILVILLLAIFYSSSANAFFEKRMLYRDRGNRPPFLESYNSPGRIYLGGGFHWGAYGRVNDTRGFGMSEKYNEGLYKVEEGNAYPNAPSFSHSTKNMTHGYIFVGYAPREGILKFTRHELEFGTGGYSKNYPGVSSENAFCADSADCTANSYSGLSYKFTQRYMMYNLYLQTDMSQPLNYFMGGGIGMSLNSIALSGVKSGSTDDTGAATDLGSFKNGIAPIYALFVGGTYDISDSIVIQGKLKAMITDSPTKRLVGGKSESIEYTNDKYRAQNQRMITTIGLDVSIIFGW